MTLIWDAMLIENSFQTLDFLLKIGGLYAIAVFPVAKLKVLWAVIGLIAILVMYRFVWLERSSKVFSHYKTMFEYPSGLISVLLDHSFRKLCLYCFRHQIK